MPRVYAADKAAVEKVIVESGWYSDTVYERSLLCANSVLADKAEPAEIKGPFMCAFHTIARHTLAPSRGIRWHHTAEYAFSFTNQ